MTKKQKRKPGEVQPGKVAVLDDKGRLRGHVGPRATSVSASRFTGKPGAVLGKTGDRDSWSFPK